jgi:Dolichyl-phosphate-mannose-protein mannosyltransferase
MLAGTHTLALRTPNRPNSRFTRALMQGPQTPAPSADPRLAALPGAGWSDLRWLLLLLALVLGVRLWQVSHTTVLARDSVGYISIAWRLSHEDWRHVLPTVSQHPGYPVAMLPLAAVMRSVFPDDPARAMQWAAQLTDVLFSVILVVPLFYLGKELFDARVGFWAVVLFEALPATSRLMVDGLSEPVFLLFAIGGLACACRGLRTGSIVWFALTGLLGALAYLTRVEGALVVGCTGLVLIGCQLFQSWRKPISKWLSQGAALAVPAIVVALPYILLIGSVTVKPIKQHLLTEPAPVWKAPAQHTQIGPPHAESMMLWAGWMTGSNVHAEDRIIWAFQAIRIELVKASFYILWLPALLGLYLFRDRLRSGPVSWLVILIAFILLAMLYKLAQIMGYLSERHAVLVVILGLYPAVAALAVLGKWASIVIAPLRNRAVLVTTILLVALSVAPLSRSLAALHADRAAFRQAGEWIARHAEPDDQLIDPYGWSGYYAGRYFENPAHGPAPTAPLTYVVLEENGKSNHDHLWWLIPPARELVKGLDPIARFPSGVKHDPTTVCVYRVAWSRRVAMGDRLTVPVLGGR